MGKVKGDAGVQVARDSAGEGMVIDIPHDKEWRAPMPGGLIISGHLTNVQPTANGSRRRDKVVQAHMIERLCNHTWSAE